MTSLASREPDLRIYAERSALPSGMRHVAMLNPFWGNTADHPDDPSHGRFAAFVAEGPSFLTLTSFDDANVVLYPVPWELAKDDAATVEDAQRLARLAAEHGKPFLIFFASDSAEPVPIEPSVVFRTSLYRSRAKPTELAMPAWSEDFVERYLDGKESIRSKSERPLVGFCGYDTPRSPTHKALVKRLLGRPTVSSRGRARAALEASPAIDTRFVVREGFFGGSMLASGEFDYAAMRRAREEYVRNMVETDYALAVRGSETWGPTAGNFSYRLYEILSCGRPPVFVDTDCVLPFQQEIDWTQFTVWVDQTELASIADRLVDFHARLDDDSFAELQHRCREVWLDYLSPQGFFRHLHLHFHPTVDGRLSLKAA